MNFTNVILKLDSVKIERYNVASVKFLWRDLYVRAKTILSS